MRRWRRLSHLLIGAKPERRSLDRLDELRRELLPRAEKELAGPGTDRAWAVSSAHCVVESERLPNERLEEWTAAIGELKNFPNVLRQIYDASQPQGARLQAAARAGGLEKPQKPK
jgi:hypothetical protein